jgi:CRISPR-associated protein Cmr1
LIRFHADGDTKMSGAIPLPEPRRRRVRGGPVTSSFSVNVVTATPILGGGSRARKLDNEDAVRAPTVRGHLRFWWRALYAGKYGSAADLYAAEAALWGKAAGDKGGRSAVDIRVDGVENVGDASTEASDPMRSESAYALWPARGQQGEADATAPRRKPGVRFTLSVIAAEVSEPEVRNAVRAWLLFGGYGSRTRRGVGGLSVVGDRPSWLPKEANRDGFRELFDTDVFASSGRPPTDTPVLAGAALYVGPTDPDAQKAWLTALGWLKEFRQGTGGDGGQRAREPGRDRRPGISNWPEPDKIRHLTRKISAHRPRYGTDPAWPRAGFGLPIIGRFQMKGRDGVSVAEPGPFTLKWRKGEQSHDRLASPLIVKALALTNGFAPCALWLNRSYPSGGEVYLDGMPGSGAPFDRLLGAGDRPQFNALAGKSTIREAFLDWLRDVKRLREIVR